MIPDWQLPPGVDRGLWDYLHADDMVRGYDEQMAASPLASMDVLFCEEVFSTPGRLVDLGCGTGRLCVHFARKGFECVGVDLSEEMLAKASENNAAITWIKANLVELFEQTPPVATGGLELAPDTFDYAACLFSTLGMVRGEENRAKVVANAFRLLKPGGRFVLHVHNRRFAGLGMRRALFGSSDIAMSQAYGGALLTLHHFTLAEAKYLLRDAGFEIRDVKAIGVNGKPARGFWRVYGWLIACEKR
jgi:SAM-dependent methyltransferase